MQPKLRFSISHHVKFGRKEGGKKELNKITAHHICACTKKNTPQRPIIQYVFLHLSNISFSILNFLIPKAGKFPKFMSKDMEALYIEELKSSVNLLMANLESMPVSKGGEFKLQKLKRGHNTSIIDMGQEDENQLSKSDVVLSFTLEVPFNLSFYMKHEVHLTR